MSVGVGQGEIDDRFIGGSLRGIFIMDNNIVFLHGFLTELRQVCTEEQLEDVIQKYSSKCENDEQLQKLIEDGAELCKDLISARSKLALMPDAQRIALLTESERWELAETERLMLGNLFDYHFQPMVNTSDGSIYSYEALMRPKSELCPNPYHILKYADIMGRLNSIEFATFLNVLSMIDKNKEKFNGHRVFINSIPRTKLSNKQQRIVVELLMKHSETVVVELTEQAELEEDELDEIKERYHNMGVEIAIDDYGTGYSNVKNLLRYMPNFVKIDRSLLSNIQDNPKKRHFVREIIDFCHENEIIALAEGVETAEELREVILLGADLIQGFYTAPPSPEPVKEISHEIIQEMNRYRQEREDGKGQLIYSADSSERVQLDKLIKDDLQCLLVGTKGSGSVTVIGNPTIDTEVHIETVKGFKGTIVLDNVRLSNIKMRPCIDIGDDSEVTLELCGENILKLGGIRVPESSKLTLAGDGDLRIDLKDVEYYGIGNDMKHRHGDLILKSKGQVMIRTHGRTGVGIGSGLGGKIVMSFGRYDFNMNGDIGIGVGAVYKDAEVSVDSCDISGEMLMATGSIFGSVNGNCKLDINMSSIIMAVSGREIVCLGTIAGDTAEIDLHDSNALLGMRGLRGSTIAAMEGKTKLKVERASLKITSGGQSVLALGGFSDDNEIVLNHVSADIKLDTAVENEKYTDPANYTINNGKFHLELNGKELS